MWTKSKKRTFSWLYIQKIAYFQGLVPKHGMDKSTCPHMFRRPCFYFILNYQWFPTDSSYNTSFSFQFQVYITDRRILNLKRHSKSLFIWPVKPETFTMEEQHIQSNDPFDDLPYEIILKILKYVKYWSMCISKFNYWEVIFISCQNWLWDEYQHG